MDFVSIQQLVRMWGRGAEVGQWCVRPRPSQQNEEVGQLSVT